MPSPLPIPSEAQVEAHHAPCPVSWWKAYVVMMGIVLLVALVTALLLLLVLQRVRLMSWRAQTWSLQYQLQQVQAQNRRLALENERLRTRRRVLEVARRRKMVPLLEMTVLRREVSPTPQTARDTMPAPVSPVAPGAVWAESAEP